MSEKKYHVVREGNHFKLSSQEHAEPQEPTRPIQPITPKPKRVRRSIGSMIGGFFSILFSGIVAVLAFLVATPFFVLSVLYHWVIMFIGMSIFWVIAFFAFHAFILDSADPGNPFDSGWTVLAILTLAFIGSILSTLGQMRD